MNGFSNVQGIHKIAIQADPAIVIQDQPNTGPSITNTYAQPFVITQEINKQGIILMVRYGLAQSMLTLEVFLSLCNSYNYIVWRSSCNVNTRIIKVCVWIGV